MSRYRNIEKVGIFFDDTIQAYRYSKRSINIFDGSSHHYS